MKSYKIIILIIFIIAVLWSILFLFSPGNSIIPKSYDLSCREKNTGDFITMEGFCESVTDCQNWENTNCGPENSCNNVKTECKNNKCVSTVYFRLDQACV